MGCRNATVLNAPVDDVWRALRDFHDLSWSANVVESVEAVGDAGGTEVGARRVLNGAFHETLRQLDDTHRVIRYSIDEGPGPLEGVQDYMGTVLVQPVTAPADADQTVVVWNSDWASQSGEIHEFCDPVYRALLADLKEHFG